MKCTPPRDSSELLSSVHREGNARNEAAGGLPAGTLVDRDFAGADLVGRVIHPHGERIRRLLAGGQGNPVWLAAANGDARPVLAHGEPAAAADSLKPRDLERPECRTRYAAAIRVQAESHLIGARGMFHGSIDFRYDGIDRRSEFGGDPGLPARDAVRSRNRQPEAAEIQTLG